jgi:hypothetical protein
MKLTAREIWLRQQREAKLKAAKEKIPGPEPGDPPCNKNPLTRCNEKSSPLMQRNRLQRKAR